MIIETRPKLFFVRGQHLNTGKYRAAHVVWDHDEKGANVSRDLGMSLSEMYGIETIELRTGFESEEAMKILKKMRHKERRPMMDYLIYGEEAPLMEFYVEDEEEEV